MEKVSAAAFAEESCEAMLSRLGHRCDIHKQLVGLDATFDLFLTLPPPSRKAKATRGGLRRGLVDVFAARMRRLLASDGNLPYAPVPKASTRVVVVESAFPLDKQSCHCNFIIGVAYATTLCEKQ